MIVHNAMQPGDYATLLADMATLEQSLTEIGASVGAYYTPRTLIEPAAGSGNYLTTACEIVGNPPYAAD